MNWLKKEYNAFKNSRTIRLAYAQKALGLITAIISLMPSFRGYLTPELFAVIMGVSGFIVNKLRKSTTEPLSDK